MEAIVLTRRDFRESDQVISVLTKEQGRLDLVARGVKKIISKNAAHLEPFSYVHITVEPGREFSYLTKVQPIEMFSSIRVDAGKSLAAGFLVYFTHRMTQAHDPDIKLFLLLRDWLFFVAHAHTFHPILLDAYVMKFFAHTGVTPVLDRCVISGKTYHAIMEDFLKQNTIGKETSFPGFYFAGGGLVAPEVRAEKERIGEEVYSCGLKEISDMRMLLNGDWRAIDAFSLEKEEQTALHKLVYAFAIYHSERELTDWGGLATLEKSVR